MWGAAAARRSPRAFVTPPPTHTHTKTNLQKKWFDFYVFTGLNVPITAAFAPPGDPHAAALFYWGAFALAYVARPAGSILFGSIGDTRGRRASLLCSIAAMAGPTVLIGCLPTYAMIGRAAPILLLLLRLIQGLAMG